MEEKLQPVNKIRDFCHVNIGLLPFKLHFFFIFGGLAGVLPFMPLIAKQLGIPATAVGIAYSSIPIFVFLSNPNIGIIVDYFQTIKFFLIGLLIMSSVAYSSILTLPSITHGIEDEAYVQISYRNDSTTLLNISTSLDRTCLEVSERKVQCELGYANLSTPNDANANTHQPVFIYITHNFNESGADPKELMNKHWIMSYIQNTDLIELKERKRALRSMKCLPNIHHCFISTDIASVFSTYQYWTFFVLIIFGDVGSTAAMGLSTVACYKILDNDDEAYGRQRLFGTISWGLVTTLAGILTDEMTSTGKSFLPGFYLLGVLITVDIVILYFIYIPKTPVSTNMCKDLGGIFRSKEIVVFSFGVALVGFLTNVIFIYEFWFLEDMGASRTLLGLSGAMQCLLGEVPFLYFSGWIVKKLGHFLCLTSVFAAFALRLLLYSFLQDPWFVLPIDILHGVTFGLYHGTMASFAKAKAPQGMEATLLGFFGGLCDGLGYGIGSFLGGLGLDKVGARTTFFLSSILSLGCFLTFLVASYIFRSFTKREVSPKHQPAEMDEMLRNE